MRLTLASYNIHRCIGLDGRFAPQRIFDVLCELRADVIALQEVETTHEGGLWLLDAMSARTGLLAVAGPNILRDTGHYGNALLARSGAVAAVQRIDLSFAARVEPREAIMVDLEFNGFPLQVTATHLGLRPGERRYQINRLLELMSASPRRPAALMGDVNEWLPWARPLRWLNRRLGPVATPPTFPATFPVFALDRIWVRPPAVLLHLMSHQSALARVASDHLPLKALVEL